MNMTVDAELELSGDAAADALVSRISAKFRLAEEPTQRRSSTYYDTFDWALFRDGGTLELRQEPNEDRLAWCSLDGGSAQLIQDHGEPPVFAEDLPAGRVRSRILGPAGIRRLLPVMVVRTAYRTFRALDEEDKTVVRLVLEAHRFEDPQTGATGDLPPRVRLFPVRGYDAELSAVRETLVVELRASRPAQSQLAQALAATGRDPDSFRFKRELALVPDARSDETTRKILLSLLEVVQANVPGARDNLDPEFLHDLRVAVRRTRSALSQIKGVFPADVVEHYKARFAWLQQVTGPVRDLDVYLLDFPDYQQALPAPLRRPLEPLRGYLIARYDAEQRRLAETLDSHEVAQLLSDWRAFLVSPLVARPDASDALRPVKELADARIWRMFKRVRKEGRAITPASPAEEMHELRKSCKKLRYLMEFFLSLYPSGETKQLIKLLKNLLDNLGSFQDLAVQADHLRDLAVRMRDAGQAETDTLLAMGALVGHLLSRQEQARADFAETFASFIAGDAQQQFRMHFGPKGPPGASSESGPTGPAP